jgi:hypothetical protein
MTIFIARNKLLRQDASAAASEETPMQVAHFATLS